MSPSLGEVRSAGQVFEVLAIENDTRAGSRLTVLADHHHEVCRQLAGPVESRFDGLAVTVSDDGAATLDDGLVRYDCSIHDEVVAGDHTIVLLRLHAVDSADTSLPLVFHRSAFGRLAG